MAWPADKEWSNHVDKIDEATLNEHLRDRLRSLGCYDWTPYAAEWITDLDTTTPKTGDGDLTGYYAQHGDTVRVVAIGKGKPEGFSGNADILHFRLPSPLAEQGSGVFGTVRFYPFIYTDDGILDGGQGTEKRKIHYAVAPWMDDLDDNGVEHRPNRSTDLLRFWIFDSGAMAGVGDNAYLNAGTGFPADYGAQQYYYVVTVTYRKADTETEVI